MNKGTKIRSALAVAIALYTAFLKTDVADFGNNTVNLIYQICMKLVTFVVIFLVTYYNNDYSEEGCVGTGVTRQLKKERGEDYEGEIFYDGINCEEEEEVEDDE